MATAITAVFQLVRQTSNDPQGEALDNDELLVVANRVLNRLFTERKDLFCTAAGTGLATAPTALIVSSNIPIDDEYAQLYADMIISEIESTSDEERSVAKSKDFDGRSRR